MQLFRKYDKGSLGVISGNDLKRGWKPQGHEAPARAGGARDALRAHFGTSGGAGVDGGLDAPVDSPRLVSWLNPVRLDKVAKRASKVLKRRSRMAVSRRRAWRRSCRRRRGCCRHRARPRAVGADRRATAQFAS